MRAWHPNLAFLLWTIGGEREEDWGRQERLV